MVNQVASLSYIVENNAGKESAADFEKAIKLCGYGKFHYGFVLLCGAMFLCVGCQNGINAYILPSAECDLDLSSEQKGLLNVAFLLGGVVSSLFWGVFADAYGRRYILLLTLLSDSILSIGGSFSQSFKVLLIFRALSGFFMGAPGSLVYTYLGEFHAAKHRVKAICYVGFFWTLSWLILPGLAWIIIPLPISLRFNGMLYNSWRLFLAIIGIPTLMVTLIATRYPESPKFLVSQGKTDEALAILRKIYAINTGRNEDDYPLDNSELYKEGESIGKEFEMKIYTFRELSDTYICYDTADGNSAKARCLYAEKYRNRTISSAKTFCNITQRLRYVKISEYDGLLLYDLYEVKVLLSDDTMNINNVNNTSFSASRVLMELLKNIWQQMRSLASPPLLKYALLCWTIYFANMCGYYGFGLWLPELFNRFESYQHLHPNRSVSVCKLIQESDLQATVTPASNISLNSTNVLINSTTETDCSSNMDEMVFINSLTINAFCLLGNIVSGYLANRVGRRTIPVTTMLLAGMFGFAIYFVESSLQILMVSCMFSLMIVTANFVISSIVVDIFPTHVGAVAICMMTCFGRIGAIASNLAFGMLLDISCEVPIFLVGSIVIFGGLLALILPQKKS